MTTVVVVVDNDDFPTMANLQQSDLIQRLSDCLNHVGTTTHLRGSRGLAVRDPGLSSKGFRVAL